MTFDVIINGTTIIRNFPYIKNIYNIRRIMYNILYTIVLIVYHTGMVIIEKTFNNIFSIDTPCLTTLIRGVFINRMF